MYIYCFHHFYCALSGLKMNTWAQSGQIPRSLMLMGHPICATYHRHRCDTEDRLADSHKIRTLFRQHEDVVK